MKKFILSFIVLACLGLGNAFAQCTPDLNLTTPGIYPDTVTGLPHATPGAFYTATMQIKVLSVYNHPVFGNVPIDSVKIVGITGKPAFLSFAYNKPSGVWKADENGCVLITGNIPPSEAGKTYRFSVDIMGYALGQSQAFPYSGYKIVVDPQNGISTINENRFTLEQNKPNPFNRETDISFTLTKPGNVDFKVFNMLGKEVYAQQIKGNAGKNSFNLKTDLEPGIYMYTLHSGNQSQSRRMIVSTR
jgi:hypothetical protein